MSIDHSHSHSHGEALARTDPTRTTTLRKRYAQKLRGRFAALNTVIRDGIVDRDIFGLSGESLQAAPIDDPQPFRFETDARKHEEFMTWLRRQLDRGVLRVIERNGNTFIQNAYHSGLQHADSELRKAGVDVSEQDIERIFNLPVHQDTVGLLYQRNYEALRGINQEVAKQISQTLSDGFSQGKNPRTIARELTDRVDTIGKTRATTLARTEVINTHSEATLNRYEQLGVDGVTIKAELSTAGDRRVCPLCKAREGKTVTIQEAREETFTYEADEDEPPSLSGTYRIRPPIHPNCRCAWLPITN